MGVRGIDTAYNYSRFTSHRRLAAVAADLLSQFTVSTKVGFFPDDHAAGQVGHSLEPMRLRQAIERSADDLGRTPDVVFLHNPERTLSTIPTSAGGNTLVAACAVLADAVTTGLCSAWGIASWDPSPLAELDSIVDPKPDVLMLRAGLSLNEPMFKTCEHVSRVFGVPPERRWGMSPFGSEGQHAAWQSANLDVFVPGQRASVHQAAFRLAFELPPAARIAVGTSKSGHLADLVDASGLTVDPAMVRRYRSLIAAPAKQ
nr:hypothetical protein [Kibdelosporangium sp. MJ126-NF4]CTQ88672.1 hypothetical protein [Kibdelosporangium sp. MJ126-NF4]